MMQDERNRDQCSPSGGRTHNQARQSIVSLLRGSNACPVVAALAELGLVDRMLAGPFTVKDFPEIVNADVLASIFRYLHALNIVRIAPTGLYTLTEQGRTIMTRSGAFLLLFSYREYFANLSAILTSKAEVTVDRRQNVLGSGALHSRKFFPAVFRMLKDVSPAAVIDVGCGDGQFLENAFSTWGDIAIAAIDLSPIAVATTKDRLRAAGHREVSGIVEDGGAVEEWVVTLPSEIRRATPLIVSMWFVAHEFSLGDPRTIVHFFVAIREKLPAAEIILGEIVSLSPDLLAVHRDISIMPEFLLFHELSRQNVLSWEQWRSILREIPYTLAAEQLFDVLLDTSEVQMPSSFVWHLKPI